MRILLFGKGGQLGWELRRSLAPLGEPPYLEEVVAGEGGQDMILYHPVRPV